MLILFGPSDFVLFLLVRRTIGDGHLAEHLFQFRLRQSGRVPQKPRPRPRPRNMIRLNSSHAELTVRFETVVKLKPLKRLPIVLKEHRTHPGIHFDFVWRTQGVLTENETATHKLGRYMARRLG